MGWEPSSLGDGSLKLDKNAVCCTGWVRGDGRLCKLLCSSATMMGRCSRRWCRLLCSSGKKTMADLRRLKSECTSSSWTTSGQSDRFLGSFGVLTTPIDSRGRSAPATDFR
ncbi:hypothetical protein CRG98_029619 [Punica granatum]|uniref:Uncharacterized protein n=1 Tax=Punica granatum TaxID=22663 RepID=A0A2I0J189_PUNGR|nr:hypothetical protein CRG98_029619 [Punica granatum]